jgi:hypothetical protein
MILKYAAKTRKHQMKYKEMIYEIWFYWSFGGIACFGIKAIWLDVWFII